MMRLMRGASLCAALIAALALAARAAPVGHHHQALDNYAAQYARGEPTAKSTPAPKPSRGAAKLPAAGAGAPTEDELAVLGLSPTPAGFLDPEKEEGQSEEEHLKEMEEEEEEVVALKWTIVVSLVCLMLCFCIAHYLESIHFDYLPEAGVAVLLGIIASAIFKAYHGKLMMADMRFDFEFFMIWLLPPIIFEAGYNMNRKAFFDNIIPTALYAFFGTVMSAFCVAGFLVKFGAMGVSHPFGGLAALTFGSLISATDPVTVLAVFQALGVKVDLFSMVFGESVMNDAVAIVLSRTVLSFKYIEVNSANIGMAVVLFLKIFLGSTLIGVLMGMLSSLVMKKADMGHHADALFKEAVMIAVFAWAAYYIAEAYELSGIVAILFCGIVMAKYTRDNLSDEAKALTSRTFKVVALLSETFVFVYLGMAAFAFPIWTNIGWSTVFVALLACFVGRLHIYLFSAIVNLFRRGPSPAMPPISLTYMHVMWFSGLRGGVAFAIAAVGFSNQDFPANDDSLAIMQTTLVVALFTIFVMGGTITDIAKATGILEPKGGSAKPKPAARKTIDEDNIFGRFDKLTLRPFLTNHHKGVDAEVDEGYDEGCRAAAVTIQRSWRKKSPSARLKAAGFTATMQSKGKSTDEIKKQLGAESFSMEDKVDSLRLQVPGASSNDLRKILQQTGGDMAAALKIALGK
ncbi:hypothetical protein KFE25_012096 [Diacronema lutheri]|uniref:Sodium/hydrogen exchanger n=1 Tax=Diacronema lutheri TaxID=2081491 RepID=A0A8J6C8V0_DIALT|nr:hypothetical protein KFE25_012096 [Diacronema lutheri]